jgi:hypothetical protein
MKTRPWWTALPPSPDTPFAVRDRRRRRKLLDFPAIVSRHGRRKGVSARAARQDPARAEINMEDQSKNMKAVWAIVERASPSGGTKSYWTRVGVGFVNRDGSLNLHLDAIPLSGRLQVREWEPYERRTDPTDSQARQRLRPPPAPAADSIL